MDNFRRMLEEEDLPFEDCMGGAQECIVGIPVIRIEILDDLIDKVRPVFWEVGCGYDRNCFGVLN
jgi:hypothetical protein